MFKVLIVDDNFTDREGIKDLIDWKSLEISSVELAINGMDGYNKALEGNPDLIVTDVSMPVMDGLKMAEKIREERPDIKFIFMSCFDELDFIKNAVDVNAYGYILKPINIEKLMLAISKVLKVRRKEISSTETIQQLEKQMMENMPFLQEQLARDLLYGSIAADNNLSTRLFKMNMDIKRYYAVAQIQIDNFDTYYENNPIENNYLIVYNLKRCMENVTGQVTRMHVFVQNYTSLAALLYLDDACDENEALSNALLYMNECKDSINALFKVNITIGLGGVSDAFDNINGLFKNAEYAVKSKIYSRGNSIILADEVKDTGDGFKYNMQDLKNAITAIVEGGDRQAIAEFVNQYYNTDKPISGGAVRGLCFAIVSTLQIILYEHNEDFSNIFVEELTVWKKLFAIETIVDVRQWLINVLTSVWEHLQAKENSRYAKLIDDIKAIIEEHFSEINNIGQITEQLYISTSHANNIFKSHTGETIFDYLIKIRMEEAKKMLADPYFKVYEVSEKIGYQSKTYFASVFKEYTGITPKEYRSKYTR